MKTPEISVIMLTYNRRDYVGHAIEAILAQHFPDFEFIMVDNGSDDGSGDVCAEYAARDPRLKVIRKEKGNIGSGRNAGLDAARGRYIAFVDDDDVAEPDMLSFLHHLSIQHGADISFCGSMREQDGVRYPNCVFEETLLLTPQQAVYELFERKRLNAATPTKLFQRQLFDGIRFLPTGKYDDISVVYKLFASAQTIVGNGSPKYCFLRHDGNNSAFTDNDGLLRPGQLEEYFKVYQERTEWVTEKFPEMKEYLEYSEWSFYLSMFNKITAASLQQQLPGQVHYLLEHVQKLGQAREDCVHVKAFERENYDRLFCGE